MKSAILVCELYPRCGASGQEKYNNDIAITLRALGYAIDLIVTTPRRDLLPAAMRPAPAEWNSITLLHFRRFGTGLMPVSLASSLRTTKRVLARVWREGPGRERWERRGSRSGKVARIGRWLGPAERTRIARAITRRSPDLVLTDTIFRDHDPSSIGRAHDYRRLLIMHDIFHLRCESFRDNGFTPNPDISRAREVAHWAEYDGLIAINAREAGCVAALLGDVPVQTAYPTIARFHRMVRHERSGSPAILFLGANGSHNQDALAWFVRECWPAIIAAQPSCTLHVVGDVEVPEHAGDRVVAHGRLDDLAPVARQCRVAINPVRMGSGLKIKMLDYLGCGLSVVTSTIGAEGYPEAPPRPFVVADTPADFIAATTMLLVSKDDRYALSEQIADYLALFSPHSTQRGLATLIAEATNRRCPT